MFTALTLSSDSIISTGGKASFGNASEIIAHYDVKRKQLDSDDLMTLKNYFKLNQHPSWQEITSLAETLQVESYKIVRWFRGARKRSNQKLTYPRVNSKSVLS